nr:hypothetical protein [Tanacetum cinerariifolium]
ADRPEVTLPPRKRLSIVHCPGYEAEESSVAAAVRPMEGCRADYGFVDSVEAEIRRQRVEDIGYGIRDTWIDPRDVAEEEALTTLEGVNTRVTELAAVQEHDTQNIYEMMDDTQEARCAREAWAHSIGLGSAVHFELQGYMTHTWVQDQRIDAQDTLIATLTTQLSSLQGHLVTALGEIRVLQARKQARAGALEGAGSTRDANRTGDDSHTSGTGVRRTKRVTRECTYQDFMKCQPLYFKATEGVVELTQCLTWWNSYFRIIRNDAAYVMTWIELKKKMTDKYCPKNEMKKIKTEF